MTNEEWNLIMQEIRVNNAVLINRFSNKRIEVSQETEEIQLLESPIKKGHYVYIPF